MKRNLDKDSCSVLLNIPNDKYNAYLETLKERGLKRTLYSERLFNKAIEEDMTRYEEEKNVKKYKK